MVDTVSIVIILTVVAVILLLFLVSWYVRRKASRLNEREFHVWFQKVFFGMTGHELTELPERKPRKRQAGEQSLV